jgi:C1A family cysteine protease
MNYLYLLFAIICIGIPIIIIVITIKNKSKNSMNNIEKQFEEYIKKHGYFHYKKTPEEYNKRFEIYKKNTLKKEVNKKALRELSNPSFTTGETQFSAWTDDEYLSLFEEEVVSCEANPTGFKDIVYENYDVNEAVNIQVIIPPQYIDNYNLTTRSNQHRRPCLSQTIRNQGYCGSCYAFAFIGILESICYINSLIYTGQPYNSLIDLSVQQLIDCSSKKDEPTWNRGCNGGGSGKNICKNYLNNPKLIATEEFKPYTSGEKGFEDYNFPGCIGYFGSDVNIDQYMTDSPKRIYLIPGIDYVSLSVPSRTSNDWDRIKKLLYFFGPLISNIYCAPNSSFRDYKGGIYNANPSIFKREQTFTEKIKETLFGTKCLLHQLHSVILCGWGKFPSLDKTLTDCWILKNSWGSDSWSSRNGILDGPYSRFNRGFIYFPMNYDTSTDRSISDEDKKYGYSSFSKSLTAFMYKRPPCDTAKIIINIIKPPTYTTNRSLCTVEIKGEINDVDNLGIFVKSSNSGRILPVDRDGQLLDISGQLVSLKYMNILTKKFDYTWIIDDNSIIINETWDFLISIRNGANQVITETAQIKWLDNFISYDKTTKNLTIILGDRDHLGAVANGIFSIIITVEGPITQYDYPMVNLVYGNNILVQPDFPDTFISMVLITVADSKEVSNIFYY